MTHILHTYIYIYIIIWIGTNWMPVECDIIYILPFRIAVFKFFEKVYSLSIDISDFNISFQIEAPWYLKLNFPKSVRIRGKRKWFVWRLLWWWTSLLHSKKPLYFCKKELVCILYIRRPIRYLFIRKQGKMRSWWNAPTTSHIGLIPAIIRTAFSAVKQIGRNKKCKLIATHGYNI